MYRFWRVGGFAPDSERRQRQRDPDREFTLRIDNGCGTRRRSARQPPEDTGLGGVGVNDIGLLPPDVPEQHQQRHDVPHRMNLAHQ